MHDLLVRMCTSVSSCKQRQSDGLARDRYLMLSRMWRRFRLCTKAGGLHANAEELLRWCLSLLTTIRKLYSMSLSSCKSGGCRCLGATCLY
eukprot:2381459-Amphidinium_carterae.1